MCATGRGAPLRTRLDFSALNAAGATYDEYTLFLVCCWLGVDEKQALRDGGEAAFGLDFRAAFGRTELASGRAVARARNMGVVCIVELHKGVCQC